MEGRRLLRKGSILVRYMLKWKRWRRSVGCERLESWKNVVVLRKQMLVI